MPERADLGGERAAALDVLEQERFDLVLVGGGITGAGIAREASRRGLSVALLEANDYAAGTSSRSTKLIHGGLRYLAMGDFRLVRETALERKVIFGQAPHLAEPRWMLLPTSSWLAQLKYRLGVTVYEKLGAVTSEDVHRNWSGSALEEAEPVLARERFPYACAYREYLTDDARLVLANLRAAVARGARALNYLRVEGVIEEQGRVAGVTARCAETGRTLRIRARTVVNAAGPWVEAVRRLGWRDAPDWLHLSKGVHIQLPRERLPVRNLVMLEAGDGRILFVLPRGAVTYVGTTDTTYHPGAEVWPQVTQADVDYLLEPLTRFFSIEPVRRDEIVGAWAGLRPLIAQQGKGPGELSRRDELFVGPNGMVSIAGGKLTGYRHMALSVLKKLAELWGQRLPEPSGDPVLPGGDFDVPLEVLAESLAADHSLVPAAARSLSRLYGSEAREVLALGSTPLGKEQWVFEGEVDWAVRVEGARHLEDVLYRRNRAALWAPDAAREVLEPLGRRMGLILSWDESTVQDEISAARDRMRSDLDFSGEQFSSEPV